MTYPKIFIGDTLLINDEKYLCCLGLRRDKEVELKSQKYNKLEYKVQFRSVCVIPNQPEYILCKNTELPAFKYVKPCNTY